MAGTSKSFLGQLASLAGRSILWVLEFGSKLVLGAVFLVLASLGLLVAAIHAVVSAACRPFLGSSPRDVSPPGGASPRETRRRGRGAYVPRGGEIAGEVGDLDEEGAA